MALRNPELHARNDDDDSNHFSWYTAVELVVLLVTDMSAIADTG